jgi:transcription elongation factor GreB
MNKPRHITPEGYKKLQDEFGQLWRVERPKVTREVQEAAAHGDRSENAEYIYGKRRLREIDRRLHFLKERLESLTVVANTPGQSAKVLFGAWVTVADDAGAEHRYRLVGADESDPDHGRISVESPIGRALLGKQPGDEVTVHRPIGELVLEVLAVEYEASGPS